MSLKKSESPSIFFRHPAGWKKWMLHRNAVVLESVLHTLTQMPVQKFQPGRRFVIGTDHRVLEAMRLLEEARADYVAMTPFPRKVVAKLRKHSTKPKKEGACP